MMMTNNADPMIESGVAADRAERLTRTIRDQSFPNRKPRDSATLILIDRSEAVPKVLLGRRHERHRFMPGKFVFPGGRIEPTDRLMAGIGAAARTRHRAVDAPGPAAKPGEGGGLALAAVRETYEETGMMLGARTAKHRDTARRLGGIRQGGRASRSQRDPFHCRAITPPKRPLRFDSRFFAADMSAVAHRVDGIVGPDAELVELVWLPITEARSLDMPGITAVVLEELQDRIAAGMSHDYPVPLYRMLHKRFVREIL